MAQIHLSRKELGGMRQINKPKGRSARTPKLQEYGYHLVYAEGTKTEPFYVNSVYNQIPETYKNSQIVVEVVPQSGGRNTLDLVAFAEKDVEIKGRERKVDHAWVFFDKDSFPSDNFDNALHKIDSKNHFKNKHLNYDEESCDKNGTKWHAIWSNECFELWILLHFEYLESALNRTDYIHKINFYLKPMNMKYKKGIHNLYEILGKDKTILACKHAKKLDIHKLRKTNPSTGVYIFIEYFKLYLGIH